MKKYNYMVFIGRMQPPHKAHIRLINKALELGDRVIILIGSAFQPRTIKNPWTWEERRDMIKHAVPERYHERMTFRGLSDMYNDQQWVQNVQDTVDRVIIIDRAAGKLIDSAGNDITPTIALLGHEKDASSYYIHMFPQWQLIEEETIEDMHSTDIRRMMFELEQLDKALIPGEIVDSIEAFMNSEAFFKLKDEYDFIQKYRQSWAAAPYAPTFVTVDAVVVQSGHVLLIRRRSEPGKNLWAIPGGFVNQNERLNDAVIRELREETRLKVPVPVLKGCIKHKDVYDDPYRSLRGRTITHAFLFELAAGPLPKVKGSDDADKARWIPLAVFDKMQDQMFEDHYFIVKDMLEKL